MATLGERIKVAADMIGGLERLAALLPEIKRRTLTDYVSGKSEPRASFLKDLADVTSVNPVWLITGEGEMLLPVPVRPARLRKVGDLQLDVRIHADGGETAMYNRLKSLIMWLGKDKLDQSRLLKQLLRNGYDAVPPLDVLMALLREAGVSFDWIMEGRTTRHRDHEAAADHFAREFAELEKLLASRGEDPEDDDIEDDVETLEEIAEEIWAFKEAEEQWLRNADRSAESTEPVDADRLAGAIEVALMWESINDAHFDVHDKVRLTMAAYEALEANTPEQRARAFKVIAGGKN